MNKLVLLLLFFPLALIGQNDPVVFKVGDKAKEDALAAADSSDSLNMAFLTIGVRRTGLPADDIGKWDVYEDFMSEEALIYTNKGKKRLPMKYRDFVYYPKINMSGNDIKTLKFSKIGCGTDTLILSNCNIDKIKISPKRFKTFRYPVTWNADVVDLSDNLLVTMEGIFSVSPKMKELNLSENRIEEVVSTEDLEELDLSKNDLESLSKSFIKKGNSLVILNLSNNDIEKLPRCFKHAEVLEELDLSNNQLSRFNCNLSKCSNLSQVDLRGNPMTVEYINELRSKWENIEFLF